MCARWLTRFRCDPASYAPFIWKFYKCDYGSDHECYQIDWQGKATTGFIMCSATYYFRRNPDDMSLFMIDPETIHNPVPLTLDSQSAFEDTQMLAYFRKDVEMVEVLQKKCMHDSDGIHLAILRKLYAYKKSLKEGWLPWLRWPNGLRFW